MDQEDYKVYNDDCNNIFNNISDNSVDLILTDPLYNIAKYSTGNIFIFTSYNQIGKWHEAFDNEFDTFQFMVCHKTNPTHKIFK